MRRTFRFVRLSPTPVSFLSLILGRTDCCLVNPEREIAATMEFVDIAGLVAGASKGEGLGNQFLANIRETDAIAHVVRCFEDENVIHVANQIDPKATSKSSIPNWPWPTSKVCEKQLQKVIRTAKGGDKESIAMKRCWRTNFCPT